MKVLLGHNFYRSSAPSGEDTAFRNERDLLRHNGVDVVSYEVFNDRIDTTSLTRRVKLALDTAWSRETYEAVSRLVKRTRPDIAHFHNTFPQISPSAYAACRDNGVPVVQTLHNFRFICPGGLFTQGRPSLRRLRRDDTHARPATPMLPIISAGNGGPGVDADP